MKTFVCYPCSNHESMNPVSFEVAVKHYETMLKNARRGLCDFPYLVDSNGIESDVEIFELSESDMDKVRSHWFFKYERYHYESGKLYVNTHDEEHYFMVCSYINSIKRG